MDAQPHQPCRRDAVHGCRGPRNRPESWRNCSFEFPRQGIVGSNERAGKLEVSGVQPGINHANPHTQAAQSSVIGRDDVDGGQGGLVVILVARDELGEGRVGPPGLGQSEEARLFAEWRKEMTWWLFYL